MSVFDRLKQLARPYEDEEDDFEEFEAAPKAETKRERPAKADPWGESSTAFFNDNAPGRSNKVVNIHATTQLKVVLLKPERWEAAPEIVDHLREKRTVVLNLEAVNKDIGRRLLDFVSGAAYASEGKVKKVAINTYIVTPFNVDLMGDLVGELENNGLYNF